ncbi:MAG: DUF4955 domain-containing protein [Alistipes sp.]
MMKKIFVLFALTVMPLMYSCQKTDGIRDEIDNLKDRVTALEAQVNSLNKNIKGLHTLMKESTVIVGVTQTATGYIVELSDGTQLPIILGEQIEALVPIMGIDAQGFWIFSLDNGKTFQQLKDAAGKPIPAFPKYGEGHEEGAEGITPMLKVDAEGYWLVSYDGGKTYARLLDAAGKPVNAVGGNTSISYSSFFKNVTYDAAKGTLAIELLTGQKLTLNVKDTFSLKILAEGVQPFTLGEIRNFEVQQTGVESVVIKAPEGWTVALSEMELSVTAPAMAKADYEAAIQLILVSQEGYLRTVTLPVKLRNLLPDANACQTWNDFKTKSAANVLVDFSYAGYKHGEQAIPEAAMWGYKVFNVRDFGAIPDDKISDRQAFIKAAAAAKTNGSGVVYFPKGRYILHEAADNVGGQSEPIIITMGNLILKGDGRDVSIIEMTDPNLPTNPAIMYSSPVMINIKHNSDVSPLTDITGDAAKGTFAVEVASTTGIRKDDWVCLKLVNNDPALIAQELQPYETNAGMVNLNNVGVQVNDYHQVKSIDGKKITFYEPLMHAVESKWGWKICKYPHYENVGVEDLTFEGHSKADFKHHGSWEDDGAYKPINLIRLTNSWMRRVRFNNVSEASSIVNCANVSVMDVIIEGNRGHAAIRSQGSSRVFIGKVIDRSDGPLVDGGAFRQGAGQYHACGVSKQSMGAVIWNVDWGTDACFESHATQPRATLIDRCTGGFMAFRQGGDADQMPNHLADLTLWNLNAKTGAGSNFIWWDSASRWWKFLPPVVVGFHGEQTSFDATQLLKEESHGTKVEPESLYEAQLRLRLGYVPAWLNTLK